MCLRKSVKLQLNYMIEDAENLQDVIMADSEMENNSTDINVETVK